MVGCNAANRNRTRVRDDWLRVQLQALSPKVQTVWVYGDQDDARGSRRLSTSDPTVAGQGGGGQKKRRRSECC